MNRYKMINRIINEAREFGIMVEGEDIYIPVNLQKRKFSMKLVKELLDGREISNLYSEEYITNKD